MDYAILYIRRTVQNVQSNMQCLKLNIESYRLGTRQNPIRGGTVTKLKLQLLISLSFVRKLDTEL